MAAAAIAAIVVLGAIAVIQSRPRTAPIAAPTVAPTPTPTPLLPTPAPTPTPAPPTAPIGAVTTKQEVTVRADPNNTSSALSVIRPGIVLPVAARAGGFVRVLTPCERSGYIPLAATTAFADPPPSRSLAGATIVVDPGHGGSETGAIGPHGLKEKDVNLDIARRLVAELPGARVILTRTGDYNAGLSFRAAIASDLHATAFVSVHNNADPDGPSTKPGTETYYQVASVSSKRLAGLAYEELFSALDRYHVSWVSDRDAGAKYRTSTSGLDYYGVLRHSTVPAIITESMYISNAPEEALLAQPAVRQTIAVALGRAITRFVTTSDPGSGFVTPLKRNEGAAFALPSDCHDPS